MSKEKCSKCGAKEGKGGFPERELCWLCREEIEEAKMEAQYCMEELMFPVPLPTISYGAQAL